MLSVCTDTYSLLFILLHRLLWSYFQPGSYSEWSTLPCLNGQLWFIHKDSPFSQWHNCHFTRNAASLCIQLLSSFSDYTMCPLLLWTHWMHEAYIMFSSKKCTYFILTARWGKGKEAALNSVSKRGEEKHNKPYRGLRKVCQIWEHHPPLLSLHRLWWTFQISLSTTTQEKQWRIKSHAPSRVITNQTCRSLILQCSRHPWILSGSLEQHRRSSVISLSRS